VTPYSIHSWLRSIKEDQEGTWKDTILLTMTGRETEYVNICTKDQEKKVFGNALLH
jgi:hypothetical protein